MDKKLKIISSVGIIAAIFLISLFLISAAIIDGLVSYYKLDEIAGTNALDSHGTDNGTANDARVFTTEVAGIINTCADFSGGNDHIQLNTIQISPTGAFTVQAWINHNSVATTRTIYAQYTAAHAQRFILHLISDDTARLQIGATFIGTDPIPSGSWQHLVFVREADNTTRIYVNGVENVSGSSSTLVQQANSEIGSTDGGTQRFWDQYIDEIGVWDDEAKDADEVLALYDEGNCLPYPFVVDTCTCPGAGNDWEIDHSDYCNITDACDLTTGTLSFTGAGWCNCNASVDTTNLGDPGASGILYIQDSCLITID